MRKASLWKALGLAGAAGVAASGVLVARSERQRRARTPDEVRERLHAMHTRAIARADRDTVPMRSRPDGPVQGLRRRLRAAREGRR